MTTKTRKSVRVEPEDIRMIQMLRMDGSPEAVALYSLTGILTGSRTSESDVLHALFTAGLKAIHDKTLEIGYRREAEYVRDHPDVTTWRSVMGKRHRRPFAVDEVGAA